MHIAAIETFSVRVSPRGNWNLVRLRSSAGLTGLGEASHALGFTRASAADDARIQATLERLFERHLRGRTVFGVEAFRRDAWADAVRAGLLEATAFSALEQAMWDLAGKAAGLPVCSLLGGRLRESVPVYANINRATNRRTPEEFARNALQAVEEGFRAVKAAPFDDFPAAGASQAQRGEMADLGVRRLEAMRRAIGRETALMADCHSRFDPDLAVEIARRLEPLDLAWYEEPIDPKQLAATAAIREAIPQRLAGGEILFGREGFEPLCRARAVDVIMPDVKHCGGVLELKKIAALAETHGIEVSPHNPSGPISMAASAHVSATLPNFSILEYAWGEADWRAGLLDPPERFEHGNLVFTGRPGFGAELNERTLAERL